MTTIAANRQQIAGDRQASHSGGLKFRMKSKIFSFNTPAIYPVPFHIGLAGNTELFPDVIEFFTNPSEYKKAPRLRGGEGIVLTQDGKIYTFSTADSWMLIDQDTYSIGSGSHIAMGAMAAGASPVDAVKAAIKHDPMSGFGVSKIDIK